MNKYGLRLKELRENAGCTQDELAKKLHISRSRLAMYEQGKRQPDFEMQEILADYFNVSIDYLFGRNSLELSSLDDETKEFLDLYKKATPDVRKAVEIFLKSAQPQS